MRSMCGSQLTNDRVFRHDKKCLRQTQQKLSAELMPKLGECTRVQGHDYTRVTFGVTRVTEGAHVEREKAVKLLSRFTVKKRKKIK